MPIVFRDYDSRDEEFIRRLHAKQGFEYALPDLDALAGTVIVEDGNITHAMFLRKTAELYWLFDPQERRRDVLGKVLIFDKHMPELAKSLGLTDAHAWLPPEILTASMERTMANRGWERMLWPSFRRAIL